MTISDVLCDAFNRVRENVEEVATGLSADDLAWRPGPQANSIGWLLWHLTRVQDDHVAKAADRGQIWITDGWVERFALPFDAHATGYGHRPEDVAAVRIGASKLLVDYHDAVHARTVGWLRTLADDAYDRVVDTFGGEDITLAVRIVSVVDDDAQHVGQASYVRGLIEGE